jgi:hypothetical protein
MDKVGILETQRIPENITLTPDKYSFIKSSVSLKALCRLMGNMARMAPAGAGTPVKNFPLNGFFIFSIS